MSAPIGNNNNSSSKPIFSLMRRSTVDNEPEVSPSNLDHDRLLPIANVGRIMKQILPQNAKISKEAKETMQECVSEFIGFVTGEASEKCRKERRKTVNGDDICWAMGTLGFDDYAGPLKRYLDRYREIEGDRAVHQTKAAVDGGGGGTSGGGGPSDELLMEVNHHHDLLYTSIFQNNQDDE